MPENPPVKLPLFGNPFGEGQGVSLFPREKLGKRVFGGRIAQSGERNRPVGQE
jgi:hypothetical protein